MNSLSELVVAVLATASIGASFDSKMPLFLRARSSLLPSPPPMLLLLWSRARRFAGIEKRRLRISFISAENSSASSSSPELEDFCVERIAAECRRVADDDDGDDDDDDVGAVALDEADEDCDGICSFDDDAKQALIDAAAVASSRFSLMPPLAIVVAGAFALNRRRRQTTRDAEAMRN